MEKYAAEGKSLAKVEGKVIFVENTIPGDEVDVLLQKNKKDFGEGIALHFHKYSDLRLNLFASILVFAEVASGKCYLMSNS